MSALLPRINISAFEKQISEKLLDQSDFMTDIIDLFSGTRSGHVGKWGYSDKLSENDSVCGADLWNRFLNNSESYYLCKNEISLIIKYAEKIAQITGEARSLIDFGPGSKDAVINKTLPILNFLKNIQSYRPIDVSQEFVDGARDCVSHYYPMLKISPLQADFFSDSIKHKDKVPVIGLAFGSLISNIPGHPNSPVPYQEIIRQLIAYGSIIGSGGYLVITQDANQSHNSILESYIHPDHSAYEENIMHRVSRDLPVSGGFKPNQWEYRPVWYKSRHLLSHTLVALCDQNFWIGPHLFRVSAGESFTIDNSYKYPVALFQILARKAGYTPSKVFIDDQGRVAMHIMKRD